MILTIKFPVNRNLLYPKISAQVDNPGAGCQKRLGKFGREAVRQSEKNNSRLASDLFWIGIGKFEGGRDFLMREARKNFREGFADQLARRCCGKIDIRMREQQANQFLAGVTGSAHYRHLRSCHNAQCVFRPARVATKSYTRREDRINRIKWDLSETKSCESC